MNINFIKENRLLEVEITEEIDHHLAEILRRRIDYEIQRYMPKKVIFNFAKVNFMDSAGIGLIIGRYKLTSMLGGVLSIKNVNMQVKKILEMSGILKIIQIENMEFSKKEIS